MTMPETASPIAWSVNAYQCSSAALKGAAGKPGDLEDLVRLGSSSLGQVLDSIKSWRWRVLTGEQQFSAADDQDYRDVLARWIDLTGSQVLPDLERHEQTHGAPPGGGSEQLRQDLARAEEKLRTWQPPAPSRYATVRHSDLTEAESQALVDAVLARAAQPPRSFRRVEDRGP